MSESINDRRRILDLLATGKLTSDEAEQLLDALARRSAASGSSSPVGPSSAAGSTGSSTAVVPVATPAPSAWRWLRVILREGDQERLNLRLPLELLRGGMRLASFLPPEALGQVERALVRHGHQVDLGRMDRRELDRLLAALSDLELTLDGGRTTLRLFCE